MDMDSEMDYMGQSKFKEYIIDKNVPKSIFYFFTVVKVENLMIAFMISCPESRTSSCCLLPDDEKVHICTFESCICLAAVTS